MIKIITKEKQLAILYRYLKSCDSIIIFDYIVKNHLVSNDEKGENFLEFFNRYFAWHFAKKDLFLFNWVYYFILQLEFIIFCEKYYKDVFSITDIKKTCNKFYSWMSSYSTECEICRNFLPKNINERVNDFNELYEKLSI